MNIWLFFENKGKSFIIYPALGSVDFFESLITNTEYYSIITLNLLMTLISNLILILTTNSLIWYSTLIAVVNSMCLQF